MRPDAAVPRKGMPEYKLSEDQFRSRFLAQFTGPAFDKLRDELDRVAGAAWREYSAQRKSPQTRKAGAEFANPDYDLSAEWLQARDAIAAAQQLHEDPAGPSRFLLINASPRTEHTCPGEMSKSYRLVELARE